MYWKLFISMFKLSAFTFGGGYVIVPMMRKKFVEELGWIDEEEMLDLIAIAQSLPGVLAVNAAVLVGYRMDKVKGALISSFGTVLPPLIILSIVTMFYEAFKTNLIVAAVLRGMQIGVGALIMTVVIQMLMQLLKDKNVHAMIMFVASLILAIVFKVNTVLVILGALFYGIILVLVRRKK